MSTFSELIPGNIMNVVSMMQVKYVCFSKMLSLSICNFLVAFGAMLAEIQIVRNTFGDKILESFVASLSLSVPCTLHKIIMLKPSKNIFEESIISEPLCSLRAKVPVIHGQARD